MKEDKWIKLNRQLRKGEIIKWESDEIYPKGNNRYYRILDKFKNYADIRNIQEVNPETLEDLPKEHTQVITKFSDGYHKHIYIQSS
jgi:excinuclease UvrABC nuclease subunit